MSDGIVLASDSATTVIGPNNQVMTVYNHANKIINLVKGLGLGMSTWGCASLRGLSIATLAKDLRQKFTDPGDSDYINPSSYSVKEVADKTFKYFEQLYLNEFQDPASRPELGLLLGGYGAAQPLPELYRIVFPTPGAPVPAHTPPHTPGVSWGGDGEAVSRLVFGFGPSLLPGLVQQQVPQAHIAALVNALMASGHQLLCYQGMPIQDAIDLARFLAEVAVKYARFRPGAATIGGPIEVASITKHEGFRWISRKLYYEQSLNPPP